jgi:hypothetical protein
MQCGGLLRIMFHNGEVGNLDTNLGSCFELLFIMTSVGNLYISLGGYFKLSFIIAEVGNLDVKLGVTLCIFVMAEVSKLFYKITMNPMAISIYQINKG